MSLPRGPRAFVLAFLILTGCAVFGIVGINLVVDPFWRYDFLTIEGVNAQRTQFTSAARLGKAGVACRMQPSKAIFGTSRVEVGLDPKHSGFDAVPGSTYNMGLAGMGIGELLLTLKHVKYAARDFKQAIIGLDFLMFNANREAVVFGTEVIDFDSDRLLQSPERNCRDSFLHDFRRLAWTNGVKYALATINEQFVGAAKDDTVKRKNLLRWVNLYDPLGYRGTFFSSGMQLQNQLGNAQSTNPEPFAAEQERYYAMRVWRPSPEGRYCFTAPKQPDTIQVFRDIIRFGHENGIDIRFVINPVHARMIYAIREIGLWPTYENWKRALVSTIDEEAKAAGTTPYALWDFSGVNTVTSTEVRSSLFWEPSHYKAAAGDMILDRVLDYDGGRAIPDDFGIRLTPDTIEPWLDRTREELRRYAEHNAEEAQVVEKAVAPIMDNADGSNCGADMKALIAGSEALHRGDRQEAEQAFARAEALHEAERARHAALGAPFMERRFESALADAKAGKAIQRRLSDWTAYQARGRERLNAKLYQDAIEDFSMAISLGPPNTALHYLRGSTRLLIGDFAGALADFDAGLALDPANKTLQTLRAQALAKSR